MAKDFRASWSVRLAGIWRMNYEDGYNDPVAATSRTMRSHSKPCLYLGVLISLSFSAGCGGGSMNVQPPQQSQPNAQVQVANTIAGPMSLAMSTSFQPAEWDYQFFSLNPGATSTLGNLLPQHIRLQGVSEGVPQGTADSTSTAWDFSTLDAITQPVLSVGDHSPEFQIAKAPPFMYVNNDSSQSFQDLTFAQFAGYATNLVEYYNTGGFTVGSTLYESPGYATNGYTITYWGIYN